MSSEVPELSGADLAATDCVCVVKLSTHPIERISLTGGNVRDNARG